MAAGCTLSSMAAPGTEILESSKDHVQKTQIKFLELKMFSSSKYTGYD